MDGRGRMLWAAAIVSGAAAVALLAAGLACGCTCGDGTVTPPAASATPGPTSGGGATATPGPTSGGGATATPGPTSGGGATATPGPTSGGGATATPGPTSGGGATATPGPTSGGGATATPGSTSGGDNYMVYFTQTDYGVSGEAQDFYTAINITPIELFYGAQFVLEWDCTLFEMREGWTRNNGHGYLHNGSQWVKASEVGLNPTGDNPQCPDPKQGLVNFLVVWDDYWGIAARGTGINVSREGTLVTIGWRTYAGADYREGDTGIRFVPTCKVGGYLRGSYDYTRPVTWTGTTVEVK